MIKNKTQNIIVSIGMPVYNEEKFLAQALDSLLSQDFTDFEIIISDNASTDNTQKIAIQYAQKDQRIRYIRNDKNIGGARNFNQSFNLSLGKYFMWAGGHDLWKPNYLSSCFQILENNSNIILTYTLTQLIDINGNEKQIMNDVLDTTNIKSPVMRFNLFMWKLGTGNPIMGLIRVGTLKKTQLMQDVLGTDIILLGELSLLGSFKKIPYVLCYRRITRPNENFEQAKRRRIIDSYPNSCSHKILFSAWDSVWKYFALILKSNNNAFKKSILLISTFLSLFIIYRKLLFKDLYQALNFYVNKITLRN